LTLCSQASHDITLSSRAFQNITPGHTNTSIRRGFSPFSIDFLIFFSFYFSKQCEWTFLPLLLSLPPPLTCGAHFSGLLQPPDTARCYLSGRQFWSPQHPWPSSLAPLAELAGPVAELAGARGRARGTRGQAPAHRVELRATSSQHWQEGGSEGIGGEAVGRRRLFRLLRHGPAAALLEKQKQIKIPKCIENGEKPPNRKVRVPRAYILKGLRT
jgi:hypothetical protein